jgi:hypothetical protein
MENNQIRFGSYTVFIKILDFLSTKITIVRNISLNIEEPSTIVESQLDSDLESEESEEEVSFDRKLHQ